MPKGQKFIDWTPENDAKLLVTILAVENVHPNCENVAAAFGGPVNGMVIANRLNRLRRKAAGDGLLPQAGVAKSAKARKGNGAGTEGKRGKKGGMVAAASEGETPASDNEGSSPPPTRKITAKGQKTLTGRVTKGRNLGKKTIKRKDETSNDIDANAEDNELDAAEESGDEDKMHDTEDNGAHIKSEDVD